MTRSEPGNSALHEFPTADGMIRDLADEIIARLDAGVAARGTASFVASGGTTPGPLFDALTARAVGPRVRYLIRRALGSAD
jgi:6-phosphogluconolactonase/glucosamine-6-phosphate isomerase/deaminase